MSFCQEKCLEMVHEKYYRLRTNQQKHYFTDLIMIIRSCELVQTGPYFDPFAQAL